MGTAHIQGQFWGAQAHNWATLQEQTSIPAYEHVFERLQVGPGTRMVDIGCGAGLAISLASARGAQVTGIDASAPSIKIAHQRVPEGILNVGEIEELPYADQQFDVVTGFNAFQYAANVSNALREAKRVTKAGGSVVMVIWGRAQDCQPAATLAAVGTCLPPPPPGASGPFALSEPGRVESLMLQSELTPKESGEVACPFVYPDAKTAWAAIRSAGPVVRAIEYAGETKVKQAVLASLGPYQTSNGGYRQENLFRYVIAIA